MQSFPRLLASMVYYFALNIAIGFGTQHYERGSIVVRAQASHAEGLSFEPDSMP